MHSHADYWEFTILIKGTLKNETTTRSEVIKEGMLFVSDTTDVHRTVKQSDNAVCAHNITVKATVINKMLSFFSPDCVNVFKKNKSPFYVLPPEMLARLDNSVYHYSALDYSKYEFGNNILLSIVFQLLGFVISKSANIETSYENNKFFKLLASIISAPDFMTYSVSDLCEKTNYSRTQLNRIFQKEFNMSPHDYLVAKRMSYAQNLLLQSDLTVVDIGERIGYSNLSQFNVVFKQTFGMSPGQFRKSGGLPQLKE